MPFSVDLSFKVTRCSKYLQKSNGHMLRSLYMKLYVALCNLSWYFNPHSFEINDVTTDFDLAVASLCWRGYNSCSKIEIRGKVKIWIF